MATVNYLYRSLKDNAPLTLRLLFTHNSTDYVFATQTKIIVDKEYWDMRNSNTRDAQFKAKHHEVNHKRMALENHVLTCFTNERPTDIDANWLKQLVKKYYDPEPEKNENIEFWIQRIIDTANSRDNGKGGIGLSKGRIAAWNRLLELFKEFADGTRYKVEDINVSVVKEFKIWLIDHKGYAPTYATKKLSDLKSVLREARSEGIPVSLDFDKIPTRQAATYDDDMDVIVLTEREIESVENLSLDSNALINARKWLILLCHTGQRGEALTKRLSKGSFVGYGAEMVIDIIQKKGNKPVRIPVAPKVKEIYEQGLPYMVSTQKLNKYFKILGEKAGINTMVMGRLEEKSKSAGRRGVKKLRPKWQYISTHIGRRTFATMYYGKMHTQILMAITGHKKEATFLRYINKTNDSHVDGFFDYFQNKVKEPKKAQLSVVGKSDSA